MVKRLSLLIALLSTLLLTGCGGGGGGGGSSSNATLTAVADYTNFGTGISGQSTHWQFFNTSGFLVDQVTINRVTSAPASANLTSLPKGTYHLKIELYSGVNQTGSVVGVLDEEVVLNGKLTFTAAIGTAPTSIRVTPTTASMITGQTKSFYAAGRTALSVSTFIAPNSIVWSENGSALTIDEEGIATAVASGSGTVVATHTSIGAGAATVSVTSGNSTSGKWTIMVFLNAANDLAQFSDLNMNQMEQVAGNPDVRFVVQWKQALIPGISNNPSFIGTRRYLAKPDSTNSVVSQLVQDLGEGVDMGSPSTMLDFINWAKTNYPADRYALVVWNHGNGWRRGVEDEPSRAVSYDDEFGTSIQTWQLAQALGSNTFDIISWDASLMQMIEVAHEIQDHADYIVGSEESPPGRGLPYHLVFGPFRDAPDSPTLNLSKNFVDGMLEAYGSSGNITQSVLDTSQLPSLASAVNQLAVALLANQAQAAEIDVETSYSDVNWTTSGFADLGNAHDNNTGTSAENGTATSSDHITGLFPERFIQGVRFTGTLGVNARIQYRLPSGSWVNAGFNAPTGLYQVRTNVTGVRVAYETGTGFNPSTTTASEVRIIVQPIRGAREQAKSYSPTGSRVYRDLKGVATWIKDLMPNSTVDSACDQVIAMVNSTVKWEGHNNNSVGSNGISIDFSTAGNFAGQTGVDYLNLRFANDTQWNEWLSVAP